MTVAPNPILFILGFLIGLSMLVAGIALLKQGRWPRRKGEQPHCRACDYLLIGLASDRCPECGGMLTENTITIGDRIRRPRLAWTGLVFVLMGFFALAQLVWAFLAG